MEMSKREGDVIMWENYKQKLTLSLIIISFVIEFIFINQANGKEQVKESAIANQKVSSSLQVVISTSGTVKFDSYWLEESNRLVVEFKSPNVVSNIDEEVIVDQGVIKRITSTYFTSEKIKALKTLTFELSGKAPYKIWQKDNVIVLEIQAPPGSESLMGEISLLDLDKKKNFAAAEREEVVVQRLEAMDAVINKAAGTQLPLPLEEEVVDTSETEVIKEVKEEIGESKTKEMVPESEIFITAESPEVRKSRISIMLWFVTRALICVLGFLIWWKWKLNIRDKLKKLKLGLQEKNKLLEQQQNIRKIIEKTSLQKEKVYEQLKDSFESVKSELQEKSKLLTEWENMCEVLEKESSKKDREYEQLKCSFEFFKEELTKKELEEKEVFHHEKEEFQEIGRLGEKRASCRIPLTKDFNKTIILRIESLNLPRNIRCFVKNISFGGLNFETKEEFNEKDPVNLRLFFYGDQVPAMKIQAHIAWKKAVGSGKRYGVVFNSLEDEDGAGLSRYIETRIEEKAIKSEV